MNSGAGCLVDVLNLARLSSVQHNVVLPVVPGPAFQYDDIQWTGAAEHVRKDLVRTLTAKGKFSFELRIGRLKDSHVADGCEKKNSTSGLKGYQVNLPGHRNGRVYLEAVGRILYIREFDIAKKGQKIDKRMKRRLDRA